MNHNLTSIEAERILTKYTCPHCGERTARVDLSKPDDDAIECWNCSADIGFTVGEFQKDVHALGQQQIRDILKTQAMRTRDN